MSDEKKMIKCMFEHNFLQKVKDVQSLKANNIFLVTTHNDRFIIKKYKDKHDLQWQNKCIKQLLDNNMKGIVPFINNQWDTCVNKLEDNYFAVMPYIPGESLNPSNITQTKQCLNLLHSLHSKGVGIYGKQQIIPFESKTYNKLKERYDAFNESLQMIQSESSLTGVTQMIKYLSYDAKKWADYALNYFPKAYALYLEEQAQWERQIAHLDVAPHNFIILENQFFYLIDYDLMDYAPPLLDFIQLISRTLPYYYWSFELVNHFLDELRIKDVRQRQYVYASLIYPADLFREWLGIWKRHSGYHPQKVFQYVQFLHKNWERRRRFVYQCLAMLK